MGAKNHYTILSGNKIVFFYYLLKKNIFNWWRGKT